MGDIKSKKLDLGPAFLVTDLVTKKTCLAEQVVHHVLKFIVHRAVEQV